MLTPPDLYFMLGILRREIDIGRLARACLTASRHAERDLPEVLLQQEVCDQRTVDQVLAELEDCLERHGWQEDAALAELVVTAGRARILAAWEAVASGLLASQPAPLAEDRYTGSQLHGQGGLGRVWKANDARTGRVVALKEVRPELASLPAVMQRFVQEARITAQLEHPNIMPVYDFQEGGRTFYTMRFISGQTLQDAIHRFHQQQPPDWTSLEFRHLMRVLLVVCEAISFAHGDGVLHRDLKPANIAMGDYRATLLFDWGLARRLDVQEAGVSAGEVIGTPAFMAPEQARGAQDMGVATDVYGLGAILFTILTGQPPHVCQAGESTEQMLRRIATAPTPLARTRRPDVPRDLDAICAKAMAEPPAARYASAAKLVDEIEHWLAGLAVEALPDRWYQRLGRWLRRHPLLTQAAASFLLLLVVTASIVAALAFATRSTLAKLDRVRMEQETRDLDQVFERRILTLHTSTRFFARLPAMRGLLQHATPPDEARQAAIGSMETCFQLHPEYMLVGLARPGPWTWVMQQTRKTGAAAPVEGQPITNPQLQAFFDRCAADTTPEVTEAVLTAGEDHHVLLWLGIAIRDQERCLGVVALAADLGALFRLDKEPNPSTREVFVTDAAGQVLVQPATGQGTLTGSITARYPYLASHFAESGDKQDFHFHESSGRILGFRQLFTESTESNLKLLLVVERPIGLETAKAARTQEWLLAFTACLIVAALVVIYVMFRLLARHRIVGGP